MDRPDHLGQPVTQVTVASAADIADWTRLRQALWPDTDRAEHQAEIAGQLARAQDTLNLIVRLQDGSAVGFAEASIRHDHVNGSTTSPVGFLEGIYVEPAHRRKGLARDCLIAVSDWVRARGCTELASDAAIDNLTSHAMHRALGFTETERTVYFCKKLD